MANEVKRWKVAYAHEDGRSGEVEVKTEIQQSRAFQYGNGKAGSLKVGNSDEIFYDLRYAHGDLHKVMLEEFFGNGLVTATEI